MKIVIAPDSFKGSASSSEISQWLSDGITSHISQYGIEPLNLTLIPIADGGEGSLDAAMHAGFVAQHFTVSGPTGNPVRARIGVRGDVALVELAEASGLNQLADHRKEPMLASSFGTGELIARALDTGAKKIILAIGGSACTDAGAGALQALGAHLRDGDGTEIPHGGAALLQCASIELSALDSRIASTEFILASDVENPLTGPNGAAFIYGPQKGASPDEVRQLDAALSHFASIAGDKHLVTPGAGAAGGFGFMALTFLSARGQSGIETFLAMSNFDSLIEGADYVITGEGRFDSQSMSGKAPMGVYAAASKKDVPVILVCGQALLNSSGNNSIPFHSIFQLTDFESDLSKCINNPRPIVEKIGKAIAESLIK
jgi:glycerate kinase